MTEDEWVACDEPEKMADVAIFSVRSCDRTLRLYSAACLRWIATQGVGTHGSTLLTQVSKLEAWAEDGKPPKGVRPTRSPNLLLFNRDATLLFRRTLEAPRNGADSDWIAIEVQLLLLRDIFGNPFRPVAFDPVWRTDTALSLAHQMYESRDFSAMPIFADALQDAGCDDADILNHCRDASAPHVRGCWVVDLVLEKE